MCKQKALSSYLNSMVHKIFPIQARILWFYIHEKKFYSVSSANFVSSISAQPRSQDFGPGGLSPKVKHFKFVLLLIRELLDQGCALTAGPKLFCCCSGFERWNLTLTVIPRSRGLGAQPQEARAFILLIRVKTMKLDAKIHDLFWKNCTSCSQIPS